MIVSFVASAALCILELHKIETVVNAEAKKTTSYSACERINRLSGVAFWMLAVLLAAQMFSPDYASLLVAALFVHGAVERRVGRASISALDFFEKRKTLKMAMFCKTVLYLVLVYRFFVGLVIKS